MKKSKQNRKKYNKHSFKRKTAQGSLILQPRLVLKDMRLRRDLIKNGIKRGVPSGRDPTQLNLQPVKGKGLKNFLPLKGSNKSKQLQMRFMSARAHTKLVFKHGRVTHMVLTFKL